MTSHLAPIVAGAGVAAAHPDGAYGTVVGTFRHGCYVQVHGGMYAVAGPAVAPGPIHLIVEQAPARVPEGLAVWRDGGRLRSTEWQIDLAGTALFRPRIPSPRDLQLAASALNAMRGRLAVPDDLHSCWDSVHRAVATDDLPAAKELLEGRGGGLTPTGDDVLAGILLVHAWRGDDPHGLSEVARAAATTNLSRSFLQWAAQGQSLAPVHDLMTRAAAHDQPEFVQAVATVSAIGGSSGVALLWGIGLAASAAGTLRSWRAAAAPPAQSTT
ncbi:DUF2877 domain-containing protein [Kribbella pittospori]|uniref:DUF2877 domain-containing protein n=1 Tax=Kribbella pittospori TaxID=722689 RepID=A0A4R0KVG0_9ACTN|nr:DUF2877 domain-containing protein [Kribbella pittospori]TCC62318.1 DUF2877 domain-containing protein [Kribbella pittospori]